MVLIVIALVLSIGQWLTVPEGCGASAWAQLMSDFGHPRAASMLRRARGIAEQPFISAVVNSRINAPRDRFLRSFGYMKADSARSLYATPHRMLNDDWRAILMFAFGTMIVYFPLAAVLALVRLRKGKVQLATRGRS
ncbi:MAG TPA: hypothetical protein VF698_04435 [Thermoanaerobaculia bacterium]